MSAKSKIEWTEATWNPIAGCTKVSPGCAHCYAETMAKRIQAMGGAPHYQDVIDDHGRWTGRIGYSEKILVEPLRWRKPRLVFVNSMSDLFHESVPFEFIDKVFAVMALCHQHTFQVLTKRAERMAEYFDAAAQEGGIGRDAYVEGEAQNLHQQRTGEDPSEWLAVHFPLPNVWLGTSVENQQAADERIPHLLRCPAAVRFLSCEPLLGPVDLTYVQPPPIPTDAYVQPVTPVTAFDCLNGATFARLGMGEIERAAPSIKIDWVIVGGESGPGARPMHPDWTRSIRDQCDAAGVPFFFKQWGEHAPWDSRHDLDLPSRCKTLPELHYRFMPDGTFAKGDMSREEFDRVHREGVHMVKVGKKVAGRLLDGVEHNAMPEAHHA